MCSFAGQFVPVVWVSLPPSSFSSTHKDAQFIARARELGASGYVNKLAAETELVRAIQTTASGEEFFRE
jgi:DNA-binding NarL/FixJ family response regulator